MQALAPFDIDRVLLNANETTDPLQSDSFWEAGEQASRAPGGQFVVRISVY